jgi:uncharacterized membrane protein
MKPIRLLRRYLPGEAQDWVDRDLITAEQGQQILALYGATLPTGKERSLGYYVLLSLSALMVGLAVILIVSANWENIPRGLRMGGLIATTATANLIGLRMFHRGDRAGATVAFFLGSILYGASIMLIAQIYHLGEHFPDGVYWWALGVLPIAILAESYACMALFTLLSFIWAGSEASFEFFPLSFIVFMGAVAWFSFRVKESVFLFLAAVVGASLWFEFAVARGLGESGKFFDGLSELFLFAGGMLILLNLFAEFLEQRKTPHAQACGAALRIWVIRLVIFSMIIFGFHQPWIGFIDGKLEHAVFFGTFLMLAALGGAIWTVERAQKHDNGIDRLKASLPTIGLSALLVIAYGAAANGDKSHALLMQIITNLAAFAMSIRLISRGIQSRTTHLYYTGVATILIMSLCRYVDLIGDFESTAALFVVCGVLLFRAARFWQFEMRAEPSGIAPESAP